MKVHEKRDGTLEIAVPLSERAGLILMSHPKHTGPKAFYLQCYYEQCERDGKYRWWQTNWWSDQFDIITKDEVDTRIRVMQSIGVEIIDHLPED